MNCNIDPKIQALQLKKYLKEKNIVISLGNAYEAVSRIHGYRNWDTYSAVFKAHENQLESAPAPDHHPAQTSTAQPEIKHPEQIRAEAEMEAEMAKALGYPLKHPEDVKAEAEMIAEMVKAGYF